MATPSPMLPMWYRVLAVIVGVFSIALALIVLVRPYLAIWLLIFFLALALLIIGVDRLVAGISGHPFGPMMPPLSADGTSAGGPAGAPRGPNPPG